MKMALARLTAAEAWFARPWARAVSLVAALGLSAVLLIYPYALGTEMSAATHAALPLLLLGMSAAFVHGFGFRLHSRLARVLLAPLTAWPLIALGATLLWLR